MTVRFPLKIAFRHSAATKQALDQRSAQGFYHEGTIDIVMPLCMNTSTAAHCIGVFALRIVMTNPDMLFFWLASNDLPSQRAGLWSGGSERGRRMEGKHRLRDVGNGKQGKGRPQRQRGGR